MADFIDGKVDSVHMIYNEFKSVMQQKLVVEQLLPLDTGDGEAGRGGKRPPTTSTSRRRSGFSISCWSGSSKRR